MSVQYSMPLLLLLVHVWENLFIYLFSLFFFARLIVEYNTVVPCVVIWCVLEWPQKAYNYTSVVKSLLCLVVQYRTVLLCISVQVLFDCHCFE